MVIDVLVNNAGLVPVPYRLTKQNFDIGLGVNFIGTAYFTLGLRSSGLLRASGGRVVMVSSEEHRMAKHRFDDPQMPVSDGMMQLLDHICNIYVPFGACWPRQGDRFSIL